MHVQAVNEMTLVIIKHVKGKHEACCRRRPVLKVHRISNRKHKRQSESNTQTVAIYWTTTKKNTASLCPASDPRTHVTESRPGPVGWGPKSAQRRTTGSYVFFGGERTTINPYSLLLLSDTHCTHSYPLLFLFWEMVSEASIKHTQCIHDVPIQYT